MTVSNYAPRLQPGVRVIFSGHNRHRENGQSCTVIGALPNPSQRTENQWFDVRFDDYTTGRFLEKYLQPVDAAKRENAA